MLLENSFEVPAPIERVWSYLLDVEKVAVCMPGAELTDAIDEKNYKGKVKLRLGPVSLAFSGKVTVAERDDAAHRVVLQGSGMEQRGKGRATVSVTTTAEETADGTKVVVVQDLQVQGQIASMSRGMMNDVSARLTQQFADCLQKNLGVKEEEAATAPPERAAAEAASAAGARVEPARPAATGGEVKGFSLLLSALAGSLRRLLGRLTGRARNR